MNQITTAQKLAAQERVKDAIQARDNVRSLAVKNSTWEYELHQMADRLDQIAKQIALAELIKMS